ncbi:hypothetical protein AAC387_Pa11g0952 [Persea americana]
MSVWLENSQEGGSGKGDYLITKQDTLMTSTPSGPSTLRISTSRIKDDLQNTPSEDVLVITIIDTTSGFDRDHQAELEDALDNVIVGVLASVITKWGYHLGNGASGS